MSDNAIRDTQKISLELIVEMPNLHDKKIICYQGHSVDDDTWLQAHCDLATD